MRKIIFLLCLVILACGKTEVPQDRTADDSLPIDLIGLNASQDIAPASNDSIKAETPDFKMEWCEGTIPVVCNAMKEKIEVYECSGRGEPEQLSCTAVITGDPSFCDMIQDDRVKWHCLALIKNETSYCTKLEGWSRDWCLFDFGKNIRNREACSMISDPQQSRECSAVIDLDVNGCKDGGGEYSYPCVVPIADMTGRKELCDLLKEDEKCRDELYHAG